MLKLTAGGPLNSSAITKKESEIEMIIRQEEKEDFRAIHQLVTEAFAWAEHSDGTEQDLVEALREGDSYIAELSLVLEVDKQLRGHIMFTKAKVGQQEALVLAPLSIAPCYQKQGYGRALIDRGHQVAKKLGYDLILVLGSKGYYSQFGYQPAELFGISLPQGFPSENFMALSLCGNGHYLGQVSFAKEFGID
ncbi:GNAT family N-acetyltransferase [Streptococcus pseudoporcinus]|uniref:GNAT family N-acetyltransferase n=2 Tax=Streptococcus pseudoporcinus TaxID=361101 RepID=UPI001E321859|nr:N-acetyltransferase [Streptococcus pseudoporcinus]